MVLQRAYPTDREVMFQQLRYRNHSNRTLFLEHPDPSTRKDSCWYGYRSIIGTLLFSAWAGATRETTNQPTSFFFAWAGAKRKTPVASNAHCSRSKAMRVQDNTDMVRRQMPSDRKGSLNALLQGLDGSKIWIVSGYRSQRARRQRQTC